jgi:arylsulfatase A
MFLQTIFKSMVSGMTVVLFLSMINGSCTSSKNIKNNIDISSPYNIIVILADDLGRNDLACYGNKFIETPRLDQMAKEGLQYMNAYAAAPLCSPTRASIITGVNPTRINLTEHLHGYSPPGPNQKLITPRIAGGLPTELTTIPEALKPNGYATGHFGKWHLGGGPSSPAANGYEYVYGGGEQGLPNSFFYPFFNGNPYKDLTADTKEGDYIDDALTTKALSYITTNKSKPFFITLNFYAPHVPIQGKPSLVKKYEDKRSKTGYKGLPENEYAAMVENIDYNVGRVLDHLKSEGLSQNTFVLFTSDNGGLDVEEVPAFAKYTPPTQNNPLKAGKGYIYEGGIRSPWIIAAPSLIKKPSQVKNLVSTDDVFNTCMELAQVKNQSPDGMSFLPSVKGMEQKDRDYYVHFPHYSPQRGRPGAAIISGKYKLIEWYETNKIELFDLSKDQGESTDISESNKAQVFSMKAKLDKWRTSLDAKMTSPNPIYVK